MREGAPGSLSRAAPKTQKQTPKAIDGQGCRHAAFRVRARAQKAASRAAFSSLGPRASPRAEHAYTTPALSCQRRLLGGILTIAPAKASRKSLVGHLGNTREPKAVKRNESCVGAARAQRCFMGLFWDKTGNACALQIHGAAAPGAEGQALLGHQGS